MSDSFEDELDARLVQLDKRLSQLIHAYEEFFGGHTKKEPLSERNQLLKDFNAIRARHARHKFRLGQIRTKFHSYSSLWDKQLKTLLSK